MAAFSAGRSSVGAVYTMSNAPEGNEVVVFERNIFGRLTLTNSYPTGGVGTVFTANTGSDNISEYTVNPFNDSLRLQETVAAFGSKPIDLAATDSGRYLYVLNAADGTVGAFRILSNGLAGSADPITALAVTTGFGTAKESIV